ncbi:hypothetical protein PENSPDRAFT_112512 [Peniophora sp. CONT]|nr:hypothetical protein PENSPDRAFT_112512 [Peniophora sp. CONT]
MYLADRFRESPPQCLSRTPAGGWEQRVQGDLTLLRVLPDAPLILLVDAATILYQVNLEPDGKYTMNAGSVRGVVTGALFAIYPPEAFDTDAIPLAKMVVTVVRAHDSELSIASYTNTPLHSPCVAFQVPANQAAPLHLYISRDTGPSAALSALDEEIACADYPLALSEDESSADLRVSEHGGRLEFTVGNSLGSMASGFKPRFLVAQATHIRPVLQAACHFFRHLRYTPEEHQLRDQITVALHELRIDALLDHSLRPAYQPYGENKLRFDHGNLVTDIMADDKTEYGFTITSQFDVPLHIWAFYFDCSNLTIAEYYRPPEPRGEPSIAKRGALTIGHGSGGGRPFKYFLGSGQNINVGFRRWNSRLTTTSNGSPRLKRVPGIHSRLPCANASPRLSTRILN